MKKARLVSVKNYGMTLLGIRVQSYPIPHGNCLSLDCQFKDPFDKINIVNMNAENFLEAIKRFNLGSEIEITELEDSDKHARITDKRIPQEWLYKKWCQICCPKRLIPEENL